MPRKAEIAAKDRAALELAIETMRSEGGQSAETIEEHLREDSWFNAATTAAYHCQMESLHLQPWENPPMFAHLDDAEPAAKVLLHRMTKAGISRYAPNPLAALRAAGKVT